MANQLDDINGPVMKEGRDINVIAQKIPVKVGPGSTVFEICLWLPAVAGLALLVAYFAQRSQAMLITSLSFIAVGLIVGLVYQLRKVQAGNLLMQQEQKIQHDASQIDNYLEQRVQILQNAAGLVEKAVDLDKTAFAELAALRSGAARDLDDNERNELSRTLGRSESRIKLAVENYPTLQSHGAIREAMNQNSYLQKEITAARELYNDAVLRWNTMIFIWPCKMIVAAKRGYTTRIPFAADEETKARARSKFF